MSDDYMKRVNKVFGNTKKDRKKEKKINIKPYVDHAEPVEPAELSPTERRKRRLSKMSDSEKSELRKKMDSQGLDFETGAKKYDSGGIVTKAYKNIIEDCNKKSKKKK